MVLCVVALGTAKRCTAKAIKAKKTEPKTAVKLLASHFFSNFCFAIMATEAALSLNRDPLVFCPSLSDEFSFFFFQ